VTAEFERLAYEAALRSLDKQEGLLDEMRARTGALMAVSSLAASFLGQQAFQGSNPRGLVIAVLLAFVVSISLDIFILLPKQGLIFMQKGAGVYEEFFLIREDMPEVYRRLTYDLDRFWKSNDTKIQRLRRAFTVAAVALVTEILALAMLLAGNILSS
jgi:hypothetical protein